MIEQDSIEQAGYGPEPAGAAMERLRMISYILDSCIVIPGTNLRFGLDPLIDLLPGIGDTVEAMIGIYILYECDRLGAPMSLKARMALNLFLDWLVGIIPGVGSLFNAGFKAHRRNFRLMERYLAGG